MAKATTEAHSATKQAKGKTKVEKPTDEPTKGVDEAVGKDKTFITRLSVHPSRKINLGNYETVDLDAGVEITFDTPVALDSEEVKQCLENARKFIKQEFYEQFKTFTKQK